MSETTDERTVRDRIAFLRTPRAARPFRPGPVPREVVDDVLEVARWSGSASNRIMLAAHAPGAVAGSIRDRGLYDAPKFDDDMAIVALPGKRPGERYAVPLTGGKGWLVHPTKEGWDQGD